MNKKLKDNSIVELILRSDGAPSRELVGSTIIGHCPPP